MMEPPRDLPADLLREISGRLHAAEDFVRFHAVCRPWRESHYDVAMSQTNQLRPWLVAPNKEEKEPIKIRCVFSKAYYRDPPTAHVRNWVGSADGTVVRYFTGGLCPGLHDPATAAHTRLPPFPDRSYQWAQENLDGVIYGDGSILLFGVSYSAWFKAALLRPGETEWTLVKGDFYSEYGKSPVVYHGGNLMFSMNPSYWHALVIDGDVEDDGMLIPRPQDDDDDDGYFDHFSYALQSRGELLWLSVQVHEDYWKRWCTLACALRVSVLALQEGPDKLQWVRKDCRSLEDRVLFLGWPNSFAMDVSPRLVGDGGCAYFIYKNNPGSPREQLGVFRYNLIQGDTVLVESLPQEWDDKLCTWLVPRPVIAPTKLKDRDTKLKQQTAGPRRMIQMLQAMFQCVGGQPSSHRKQS